jgi:uncharacterized protein (TIGR03382 family)
MKTTRTLHDSIRSRHLWRTAKPAALVLLSVFGWHNEALSEIAGYNPPTDGLVGWWRGEGNGVDSANGHNGIVGSGVNFVPGVYGQAFDFTVAGANAGTSRVFVPDNDAFKLTSSLTISAWINGPAQNWAIMQRGDDRSGLDPFTLGFSVGAGLLDFQITGSETDYVNLDAPPLPQNQWMQITATLDGSTGDMRIYANGNVVAETYTSVRPFADLIPAYNPSLTIGNAAGDYNFPFVGQIDEVLLYSRALSPSEVAALVPEPSSLTLCVGAAAAAMLFRRRR